MNLKDKLHEVVYVLVKKAEKTYFNKTTLLADYLIQCGNFYFESDIHIPAGIFQIGDGRLVEVGGLEPLPKSYVLTGEELLELKKKWASEAWDEIRLKVDWKLQVCDIKVPFVRKNMYRHMDKQSFIGNLTL